MEQFGNTTEAVGEPGLCECKRMEEYDEREMDIYTYIHTQRNRFADKVLINARIHELN
jgi:hypothetical protein